MNRTPFALVLLGALALVSLSIGCGTSSAPGSDSGPPGSDAGPTAADTGPVAEPDGGPVSTEDSGPAGPTATLSGNITRSTGPQNGGRGNLYVGVFTADPVTSRESATQVGRTVIENVDMRPTTVQVPYSIEGIPPRAAPYFIVAFLDDNGNAMSSNPPGPDRGDLVTLMGFASPSTTIATPTAHTLDLVLSTALPF